MEKRKALELIEEYLRETPALKALQHDDPKYVLWKSKVRDVLRVSFGEKSHEYTDFSSASRPVLRYASLDGVSLDEHRQQDYLHAVDAAEVELRKIIQRYKIVGFEQEREADEAARTPSAFIAHGGDTQALAKIEEFLRALGVNPIVAEKQPSQGRSVDRNVEWCLDKCDCAVILATKGDVDGHTGEFLPRANVSVEIGRCQERFPDKTIYLLEQETRFPSNISEKVWERFTQDNMERAFLKIARELVAFGLIQVVKAEQSSRKQL